MIHAVNLFFFPQKTSIYLKAIQVLWNVIEETEGKNLEGSLSKNRQQNASEASGCNRLINYWFNKKEGMKIHKGKLSSMVKARLNIQNYLS